MLSMLVAVMASVFFGVSTNLVAAAALGGSIWHSVAVSVIPLVMLCILIAPFLNSDKR